MEAGEPVETRRRKGEMVVMGTIRMLQGMTPGERPKKCSQCSNC